METTLIEVSPKIQEGPFKFPLKDKDADAESTASETTCWIPKFVRKFSCKKFVKKYFLEGQALNATQEKALESLPNDASWIKRSLVTHRRLYGVIIPASFFYFLWMSVTIKYNLWHLFVENYYMTILMIFAAMIAGMTSEGGASLAFPVMTLALGIKASVARDFALMIQSAGMGSAAFTIFWMRIQVEWHSIVLCSLGGLIGIIFGMEVVDPYMKPNAKKMSFVCVWFSFAFALFLLNRYHNRATFSKIPNFSWWKMIVLLCAGILGGIFSAVSGSGLDICSFSILTLLFRVSEKIATPTSVILMAGNTMAGFYWRQFMMGGTSEEAWEYVAVTVPVVVICAPLGSVIGSHFNRLVLASFVYITDTVALVSGFIIVRPLPPILIGVSCGIIAIGFTFFLVITKVGEKILKGLDEETKAKCMAQAPGKIKNIMGEKAYDDLGEKI